MKVLEKMVAVINITLHRCSIRVENKRVFRSVIKMMDVSKEPQASYVLVGCLGFDPPPSIAPAALWPLAG